MVLEEIVDLTTTIAIGPVTVPNPRSPVDSVAVATDEEATRDVEEMEDAETVASTAIVTVQEMTTVLPGNHFT
jgi:hypothetical protein